MTYTRTHEHAWPYGLDCVDIGDEVCLTPMSAHPGYRFAHDQEGQEGRCVGTVTVSPDHWQQTGSLEAGDLTLTPSVLCRNHGFHGFVRGGQWVPA